MENRYKPPCINSVVASPDINNVIKLNITQGNLMSWHIIGIIVVPPPWIPHGAYSSVVARGTFSPTVYELTIQIFWNTSYCCTNNNHLIRSLLCTRHDSICKHLTCFGRQNRSLNKYVFTRFDFWAHYEKGSLLAGSVWPHHNDPSRACLTYTYTYTCTCTCTCT